MSRWWHLLTGLVDGEPTSQEYISDALQSLVECQPFNESLVRHTRLTP